MKIRSAEDILEIVRQRGLRVKVNPGPPPMPLLSGPRSILDHHATEALMAALRAWRLEIIELVTQQHTEKNGTAS